MGIICPSAETVLVLSQSVIQMDWNAYSAFNKD